MKRWIGTALLLLGMNATVRVHAAEPDTPAAKSFQITGVVRNSRNGAPVVHCRVSAAEVLGPSGGQRGGEGGDRPTFGGGGINGGQPFFNPRGGGQVQGFRRGGPQPPDGAETDSQGRFSLTVAHAGAWRLSGAARGYRTQNYDEHDGFFSAVVLTAAEPTLDVTFKLVPDGTITGVVLDEAGEAVRQAQVRVERVREVQPNAPRQRPLGGGVAMTDDRGRYEVTGLAPGQYQVRVNARPWYAAASLSSRTTGASLDPSLDMVYAETWSPAATDAGTADEIALTGGEEREADVHLTPIPAIHLKIPRDDLSPASSGVPLRGSPTPEVEREGGERVNTTVMTNGTEWDIGGLTPGNYTVRTGSGSSTKSTPVRIAAGAPAVLGAGGGDAAGSAVTIAADGTGAGDVRMVSLVNMDTGENYTTGGDNRRGRGDADPGAPRVLTAPAGRYEVYLNGNAPLYLVGLAATGAQTQGRTITLNGGPAKLTVHAGSGRGQVNGIAKLGGKPVAGAMVLLVPADFGQPGAVAPVMRDETNTDGSFALRGAIPDEYILVTIDGGWGVNWQDPATLMKYLVSGVPVDLRGAGTVKKDVEAAAP